VAKQAAEVDVLSGGRLRLGVGLGWNHLEYQALGCDFSNRGKRVEEQVIVLRQLWTDPLVTFEGNDHTIDDAGLNPMPVQRPIPIWFGGYAEAALRRAARLGDGWFPGSRQPDDAAGEIIERMYSYVAAAGRDPAAFGIDPWITIGNHAQREWAELVARWRQLGATHVAVNTMRAGLSSPQEHIEAIRRFKSEIG
jgi:probable F420-dependent oxidoreductase